MVMSRCQFDAAALDTAVSDGDRQAQRALLRRAQHSVRQALRLAASVARERVEAYRLAGQVCWLAGKRRRAVHCWEQSIRAAEQLGARPDLARTYFEMGRRLGAAGLGQRMVNQLPGAAYVDKALELFAQLGLDADRQQAAVDGADGAMAAPKGRAAAA